MEKMEVKILDKEQITLNNFSKLKFNKITPVLRGGSKDKKYAVESNNGERFFVRIADIVKYHRFSISYFIMLKAAEIGVPVKQPIEFWSNDDNVYFLTGWIDGENLNEVLKLHSESDQFQLGVKAANHLKKIHTIPVAPEHCLYFEWNKAYSNTIEKFTKGYRKYGPKIVGIESFLTFMDEHKYLLETRPISYLHGDFTEYNMMLESNGELVIVDFDGAFQVGDPWYDFYRLASSEKVTNFASGLVYGYFDGDPPEHFWLLLAFYKTLDAIRLVTISRNNDLKLRRRLTQIEYLADWINNIEDNITPTWYKVCIET